jgi:hypothetical protein
MTRQGTVAGHTLELDEPLPLPNGARVTISVVSSPLENPDQPLASSNPKKILEGLRNAPRVSPEDLEELQRVIKEGKLPVKYRGAFDEE